jgi:type II secretory pathway pseudopilin PulG
LNAIKSRIKNLLTVSQQAVKNEKGLTLIEMLIAILIFILASVFIVSLVTSALDKPKEAGIKSAMNSYESASQLILLETSGIIAEDANGAPSTLLPEFVAELNKEVDPSATFSDAGISKLENAYGNTYNVTIATVPAEQKASIIFTTDGAKAGADNDFVTSVYYVDGEVIIGTDGFGRNDKDISTDDLTKIGAAQGAPVTVTTP